MEEIADARVVATAQDGLAFKVLRVVLKFLLDVRELGEKIHPALIFFALHKLLFKDLVFSAFRAFPIPPGMFTHRSGGCQEE